MIRPLQTFCRGTPVFRALAPERAGLNPEVWSAACAHGVDAALLRDLHRAVCGEAGQVRRADRDGAWGLVAARAGHLRSQPQSFRIGEHVEPAWDPATLARRVGAVLSEAARTACEDPIGAAATAVWSLARTQPFLGANEQVALVLAARILHAADLPVPSVEELAASPQLAAALIDPEPRALAAVLARAVWDEALVVAELVAPTSSGDTLAAEHAALVAARARSSIPPLGSLLFAIAPLLASALRADGEHASSTPSAFGDRLALAIAAAGRRRHLCPHWPIHELRWRIEPATSLDAVLVAGAPGRGITGAGALHFAIEVAGIAATSGKPAAGILILPDEAPADLHGRITAWIPTAIERALADAPQASPRY